MTDILDQICTDYFMDEACKNSEYLKREYIVIQKYDKLAEMMSAEMKKLFNDYDAEKNHMNAIANSEAFRQGIKFATALFLDKL